MYCTCYIGIISVIYLKIILRIDSRSTGQEWLEINWERPLACKWLRRDDDDDDE